LCSWFSFWHLVLVPIPVEKVFDVGGNILKDMPASSGPVSIRITFGFCPSVGHSNSNGVRVHCLLEEQNDQKAKEFHHTCGKSSHHHYWPLLQAPSPGHFLIQVKK